MCAHRVLSLRKSLFLIVLFGLMLSACESGNSYKPPPAARVTVAHPLMGEVTDAMEFTGNTQAIYTVKLRARVEGYLDKVLFREGDIVEEGKTLFVIQPESYIAKVKEADLIIAIGTRLGEPVSQGYTLFQAADGVPIIHVYPDAAEIGRVYRPALGIVSDLTVFATAAARLAPPKKPVSCRHA